MARRNTLRLNLSGFDELLTKLDKLGGDLKKVTEDALEQAAETITNDTIDAMADGNLPAKGKYSTGDTKDSIVKNPQVEWNGTTASIGVGFDYDKPGAGGFLIAGRRPSEGTPRMAPNMGLKKIYKGKKYITNIQNDMRDIVADEIERRM